MRALLALLLILPSVGAVTWNDDVGDVQVLTPHAGCPALPAPADWYAQWDVTELTFGEVSPHDLALGVTLTSLDPGSEPDAPGKAYYGVAFEWEGQPWLWYIEHDVATQQFTSYMYIAGGYMAYPGMTVEPELWGGEALQPDGTTITATWRKSFFHDDDWVPLRAGYVFEDVAPFARSVRDAPCDTTFVGTVNDALGPPEDVAIKTGNERLGSTILFSPQPSRGSNGAATTYIFDVEARNLGSLDDELSLQLQVPKDWVVRAPLKVAAPAGQITPFAVAVTVPFSHLHGGGQQVTIRGLSSAEPGKEAEVALRVWWTDPPQPGGHHPTLYLHEVFEYFTFTRTDPYNGDSAVAPRSLTQHGSPIESERTYHWQFPLSPRLSMGLDFQAGAVTGTSAWQMPIEADVIVDARLVLTGDTDVVLAEQRQELHFAAGRQTVDWQLPMASGVDRIPFKGGQNLRLDFDVQYARIEAPRDVQGPTYDPPLLLVADGRFKLPLVDYHDIITDDLASQLATLSLDIENAERRANPGKTVIFDYTASNVGATAVEFEWSVDGPQASWARLGIAKTTIAPGASVAIPLIVVVPADANDGDLGTLLLTGRDVQTGAEVFARALVLITTQEDIPDQAGQVDNHQPPSPKETPAMPLALVLLLLAGVGGARRIRGQGRR